MLLKLLLLVCALVHQVAAQCGPPQCYKDGCTDVRPKVDFVFLIDVSGSMQPRIDGVKSGLTAFAQSLDSQKIDPRFAIVRFGRTESGTQHPDLYHQLSTFGNFKLKIDNIEVNGGWEDGLGALSQSMRVANSRNLNINFRNTENSKRVFILVTDEDSDKSYDNANRFSSRVNGQNYGQTQSNNGYCPANANVDSWAYAWQLEVDHVVRHLISQDASLYMFVAGARTTSNVIGGAGVTCLTKFQYGDPDVQVQDSQYANFNAQATLNNLVASGAGKSLQAQMLRAGKAARCFEVADTANNNLINNFFTQIVTDVSKCDQCYEYSCLNGACQVPKYICDCTGWPGGKNVTDKNGACCEADRLDCAGYCNGNHGYDACGVCTAGSSLSPWCKTDCNNKKYLDLPPNPKSIPAYANLVYNSICPDIAGYLLPNADLQAAYKNSWAGSADAVCNHYHTNGRFEARPICVFDETYYNNQHNSPANPKAHWLASIRTSSPRAARCVPGSTFKVPASRDSCNQCINFIDAAPFCSKDCTDTWRTSANQMYFLNSCNRCVAPGSLADADKDECGKCNGGNLDKNQCGVCFGTKDLDACNQPVCQNNECTTQCDGNNYNEPTFKVDECGNCVSVNIARDPKCIQDCDDKWYNNGTIPPNIVDECGNCVSAEQERAPGCVQDCAGTWNGNGYLDECGQCISNVITTNDKCSQDCAGTWFKELEGPPNTVDDCGFCYPKDSPSRNSDKDLCGVCKSTAGYNTTAMCTPDCKGTYRPADSPDRAFTDFCGKCFYANETFRRNENMDDCGICRTEVNGTDWNSGVIQTDSFNVPCFCGQEPMTCPDGKISCTDECPSTPVCADNVTVPGDCGKCPENNKTRDSCQICCDTGMGDCDVDKDQCGVCFGFGKDFDPRCQKCGLCLPDCTGTYGGNATYGCDGICNSNATCITCGNGVVEEGETCDLGKDPDTGESRNVEGSGCNSLCQAESGASTGKLIGAIIGGIAAVAFLALAAFLAVKYAQKAGLIGNANKQLDMGASNSNPLYKSETSVHSNPLYGAS